MNWLYFAFLCVGFGAIANIFRRILMKHNKSDAFAFAIVHRLLAGILVTFIAFINGFIFPPLADFPFNFAVQALLWGLATVFLLKANQYLEASQTTIIATIAIIVTVISAFFFLGEMITYQRIIGTMLIITAVIYVSKSMVKFTFNKGVLYTLGFAICSGLAITNDTFLLRHTEAISYLAVSFFLPLFFLPLLQPKSLKHIKPIFSKSLFPKMFLFTIAYAFSAVFFFLAIKAGAEANQISPISQSTVIITVLLAAILLKEHNYLFKKVLSAFIVFIGILLLH